MKVKVTVELDINEVNVAHKYGLEVSEVRQWVKDVVASDVHAHYHGLGWLRERSYA